MCRSDSVECYFLTAYIISSAICYGKQNLQKSVALCSHSVRLGEKVCVAGVQRGLSLKAPFGASSASIRFLQKALEAVVQAGLRDRRVVECTKLLKGNLGVLLAQSGGLLYPRGKPRKATASAQGADGVHLPHRRRHGF